MLPVYLPPYCTRRAPAEGGFLSSSDLLANILYDADFPLGPGFPLDGFTLLILLLPLSCLLADSGFLNSCNLRSAFVPNDDDADFPCEPDFPLDDFTLMVLREPDLPPYLLDLLSDNGRNTHLVFACNVASFLLHLFDGAVHS